MSKKVYYQRKNNGLCVRCGMRLPDGYTDTECGGCKYIRKTYRADISTTEKVSNIPKSAIYDWIKEAKAEGISYGELKKRKTLERIERGKT